MRNIRINVEKSQLAATRGYLNATELADYLVEKDVPFRIAHDTVGRVVLFAISKGRELNELSLEELREFSPKIEKDVFEALSLEKTIASKNQIGGTSPERVLAARGASIDRKLTDCTIFDAVSGRADVESLIEAKREGGLLMKTWSKVNVDRFEALTAAGLMTPAGERAYEENKHRTGLYAYERETAALTAEEDAVFQQEQGRLDRLGETPAGLSQDRAALGHQRQETGNPR